VFFLESRYYLAMTNNLKNVIPELILTDGTLIPQLGFGLYKVPADEAYRVVSEALEVGYRHFDTAALYGNEQEVGAAIRDSGIPREDIYVTTKLWNTSHGRDEARDAFHASMDRLDFDYVDLYLIHWPQPAVNKYRETWETMIELRDAGHIRSIGVSNFTENTLHDLVRDTGVAPSLNQIELHPEFSQQDMRDVHRSLGVRTSAWSPLGRGTVLGDNVLQEIADKYGKTPAQVVIRWHIQLTNVVIPKTTHRDRMEENFDVFDFVLDDEDMEKITNMDKPDGRMSRDPADFNGDL